jgi:hypothetical protein
MKIGVFNIEHGDAFSDWGKVSTIGEHEYYLCSLNADKQTKNKNFVDHPSFCEMRAQYWVWKNCLEFYDYFSFSGYRKKLYIYPLSNIVKYDIIVPHPINFSKSVGEQYKQWHRAEDWEVFFTCPAIVPKYFHCNSLLPANTYVLSKQEFDNYMQWWEKFAYEISSSIEPPKDPYQSRVYAFLSERAFTFYYLSQSELKTLAVPLLVYQNAIPIDIRDCVNE